MSSQSILRKGMRDLDVAKNELFKKSLALVIVKDGKIIYETRSHRISGFMQAIDKFKKEVEDSCVADRVVGKAVALLCLYAGIRGVHAVVLSRQAQSVLESQEVFYQFGEVVDAVLDSSRTGTCPFEGVAAGLSDPEEAYEAFKKMQENLKKCK